MRREFHSSKLRRQNKKTRERTLPLPPNPGEETAVYTLFDTVGIIPAVFSFSPHIKHKALQTQSDITM